MPYVDRICSFYDLDIKQKNQLFKQEFNQVFFSERKSQNSLL